MEELVKTVVSDLYAQDVTCTLSRPEPAFGDYATNIALQLAKPLGRPPREIAEEIAQVLRESGQFLEVSVAGPGFINMRVRASSLQKQLASTFSSKYGESSEGAGKTVVVEYPSQNMAKPYSVGHLRSGNQGWAVRQLMLATGWNVITDNHLGDYGAPLGTWIVGFLHFSNNDELEKGGVYELGRIYIATKKALKDEAERGEHSLADEVQNWLLRFENGDPEAVAYSQRFNAISLEHIHKVMGRLKISTDYELGEAFFAPLGKQLVQNLLNEGVAIKNTDNSVVVPLDEFNFDVPMLIQKSNGTALYATTDLATIMYRNENWHPNKVIYSVGAEQKFHFEQLFAVAKKMGVQTELVHLWFGTIDQINEDGTREKMSSRKGVILMEELLNQAESKAREVVGDRNIDDADIEKIALGAIKFSDFIADRRTNILFSWDSIFALTGMSGPYVQYAAVRVRKILTDNSQNNTLSQEYNYDFEAEKEILLKLLDYPAVVARAARDLEPHKVATYLYELARTLNRYYEATPVATPEVADDIKAARLQVLSQVSHVFGHGLELLGIEVPSQM